MEKEFNLLIEYMSKLNGVKVLGSEFEPSTWIHFECNSPQTMSIITSQIDDVKDFDSFKILVLSHPDDPEKPAYQLIFNNDKEKYIAMADGRDCGLTGLNEESHQDFNSWYETERNCGGHPWEICRGGNSTHISLYICKEKGGWYLRLEGSSIARVIETIKMAIALYKSEIPFILGRAEEIYRMACGVDYIGIVPETVTPRYCHSYFPKEDKIIDFMNLGTEKAEEIIKRAFWYPLPEVHLTQ